ncbi:MAG: hypothetical protein AB7S36_20730 [Planctomycetota bacterium]
MLLVPLLFVNGCYRAPGSPQGRLDKAIPADWREILAHADSVELLRLHYVSRSQLDNAMLAASVVGDNGPVTVFGDYPPPDTPDLRGYPILGRTSLEPAVATEVVKLIFDAVSQSTQPLGSKSGCFNPRHGIVATRGGDRVELLICFECHVLNASGPGHETTGGSITDDPAGRYDEILLAAGVPTRYRAGQRPR